MNYKSKLPAVVAIMIMLLFSAGMVFGSEGVSEDNATLANNGENDAGNQTEPPEVPDSAEDTDPYSLGNETDSGNANETGVGNETETNTGDETPDNNGVDDTYSTAEETGYQDDHAGFDITHADELTNIQCSDEDESIDGDDGDEHVDDGGPPEDKGHGPPDGKGPGNKGKKGGHSTSEGSDEHSPSEGKGRYRYGHGHS